MPIEEHYYDFQILFCEPDVMQIVHETYILLHIN